MTESERKQWLHTPPSDILLHGPSKTYIDRHLWFHPRIGIAASYVVQAKDVLDHFGVFRGVDMIESAGQTGVSACSILLADKEQKPISVLQERFIMAFLGLGKATFFGFVSEGDTLVNYCHIHSYKFRHITFSATVYKAEAPSEVEAHFKALDPEDYRTESVPASFKKVAEFSDYLGRAVKREKVQPK